MNTYDSAQDLYLNTPLVPEDTICYPGRFRRNVYMAAGIEDIYIRNCSLDFKKTYINNANHRPKCVYNANTDYALVVNQTQIIIHDWTLFSSINIREIMPENIIHNVSDYKKYTVIVIYNSDTSRFGRNDFEIRYCWYYKYQDNYINIMLIIADNKAILKDFYQDGMVYIKEREAEYYKYALTLHRNRLYVHKTITYAPNYTLHETLIYSIINAIHKNYSDKASTLLLSRAPEYMRLMSSLIHRNRLYIHKAKTIIFKAELQDILKIHNNNKGIYLTYCAIQDTLIKAPSLEHRKFLGARPVPNKALYIHKQLVYYVPIGVNYTLAIHDSSMYYKPFALEQIHTYLIDYVDDMQTEWISEDEHIFYIRIGLLVELKQYLEIIQGEIQSRLDSVKIYYKLNNELAPGTQIQIKVQLFDLTTNPVYITTKVIDPTDDTTITDIIEFDSLTPGNRYIVQATAKLYLAPDTAIEDISQINAVTKPETFTHEMTEIHPIQDYVNYLVDWHYGLDGNINKDVDAYYVSVYDKIPKKSVWDYTDSPTIPSELVDPNLEETVNPIAVISYSPGDSAHSRDQNSFIIDVFALENPNGLPRATHYRWVEVEAQIVYNPDYTKYETIGGETNES